MKGTVIKLADLSDSLNVLKADRAAVFCRASFKGQVFKADVGFARNADSAAVAFQCGTEDKLGVLQIQITFAVDRAAVAVA